jgi:hypothetical protein
MVLRIVKREGGDGNEKSGRARRGAGGRERERERDEGSVLPSPSTPPMCCMFWFVVYVPLSCCHALYFHCIVFFLSLRGVF